MLFPSSVSCTINPGNLSHMCNCSFLFKRKSQIFILIGWLNHQCCGALEQHKMAVILKQLQQQVVCSLNYTYDKVCARKCETIFMRQIMSDFVPDLFEIRFKYECSKQFLRFQDFFIQTASTLSWMPKIAARISKLRTLTDEIFQCACVEHLCSYKDVYNEVHFFNCYVYVFAIVHIKTDVYFGLNYKLAN